MKLSLDKNNLEYDYDDRCAAPSCDSFLLADFFRVPKLSHRQKADAEGTSNKRFALLDLGAGAGLISLLLASKHPIRAVGLELCPHCSALFGQNAEQNNLSRSIQGITGDVRDHRALLNPESFDAVISNPPYYKIGDGRTNSRSPLAKSGNGADISDFCKAAAFALKNKGSFYISFPTARLCDLLCSMREHRLEPKRLNFVRHNARKAPFLALVEGIKSGGAELSILPDIILYRKDGKPTAHSDRIYGYTGDNTT